MRIASLVLLPSLLLFALVLEAGVNVWTTGGPYGGWITAITVDPIDPSVLYLGEVNNKVLKSTDGGSGWSPANQGLPPDWVRKILVDRFSPSTVYASLPYEGVFKSIDSGATWLLSNSAPSDDLVADPANAGVFYSAGNSQSGCVSKTTDSGNVWSAASNGLPSGQECFALAIDPVTSSILYVGLAGVYKSVDGGANWSLAGTPSGVVYRLAIDPLVPARIYKLEDDGVYGSSDSAATWTKLLDLTYGSASGLTVDPTGNVYVGDRGQVFKSTNHGSSWSTTTSGLPNNFMDAFAADPTNPDRVYAGACDGFYFSTDGGETWSASNNGLEDANVRSIAIDATDSAIAYAGTGCGGIFKTANGGSSWEHMPTGFQDQSVMEVTVVAITPS